MTIFEYINSIVFSKKKIELNCDDASTFSVFMLNRWISFYSNETVNYINQTTNKYSGLFDNKQDQYNFLYNIIPALKFKHINYIKKTKKDKDTEEVITQITPDFISKKEHNYNIELLKLLSK